jgi:hypothetical protein
MDYGYIVVEGPHDVEFVWRFLKEWGLTRVRQFDDLDKYWEPLVPRTFPHGGDLLKRIPVPTFFHGDTVAVAVQSAIGDTRLVETVQETVEILEGKEPPLSCIGVMLDADQHPASTRFRTVRTGLLSLNIDVPEQPGVVSDTTPRCGVFVLPDNNQPGTLEDLLIECGDVIYPRLMSGARSFLSHADGLSSEFVSRELAEYRKPSGRNKALVGCAMQVLKPGKAVQVSIQDNRWVVSQTIAAVGRLQAASEFLRQLIQAA